MSRRVRLATPADAAAIRAIYAPVVESTPISFEVEPPSRAAMAERIESTLDRYPWLVCVDDAADTPDGDEGGDADEVLGYAAAGPLRSTPPYRWTVELSVYVAEAARRSSVGTALYASLLAALEELGYYNAYAVTTLPNPASERLHERAGFEPVGTFPAVGYAQGAWRDVRWWHRRLAPRPSDPDPPRELPDARGTSELPQAIATGERHLDG